MKKLVLTTFLALAAAACGGSEFESDPGLIEAEFGQSESALQFSSGSDTALLPQCTCVQDSQCAGGRCVQNCTPGQAWGTCVYPGGGSDPTLDDQNFTTGTGPDDGAAGGVETYTTGSRTDARTTGGADTIATDPGVDTLGVSCNCDPAAANACGAGQICKIGGCTNPTQSRWGYCKSTGGSGADPTLDDASYTTDPGRGDP